MIVGGASSAWGDTYKKATSISVGDVVVFVVEGQGSTGNAGRELTSISTTSTKYGIGTDYKTTPAGTMSFEVVEGYNKTGVAFKNGSNYLYWTSGNSLATNSTLSANTSWSVSFNNGNAVILNNSDNNRQIWWNTGSPRFACYTGKTTSSSGYASIQLYKKAYNVTYVANGGTGTMTDSNSPYFKDATVTLLDNAFTAPDGYTFNGWVVTDASSNTVAVSNNQFTMPAKNVTVTAQWQAAGDYINAAPSTASIDIAGDVAEFTLSTNLADPTYSIAYYTTSAGDETTAKPSWIGDVEFSENTLNIVVNANTGAARTAYLKVYSGDTYSSVITINQAAITVETPAFDVTAGTYFEDQLVDITCETDGATIYYTTDGSTPTNESTEYDGNGVTISATKTLKAIAIKNGVSSEVASAAYTIIHPLATMDAIFEAATTAGSTATSHYVTFNNWVVTGVSGKQAFVTDGTKGFIVFKNSSGTNPTGFAVGNILSGTVQASLQLYNGSAEFTTLTSSTTGLTVKTGGTVSPYVTTIDDLSGVNTGALIRLNGVTYDSTYGVLEDASENTITPYTTLYTGSYVNTTKYNVTGVYQQQSSAPHRILPRSSADIVEVTDPTITVESSLTVPNYIVGTAEPTYETLTVNGSNLTADITLSLGVSSNFEMSTDLENWTNSLTLTETDGSVTDAEVAIRLKAGLSKGAYEGTLTLSSTGATNATVSLSGSVTGQTYAIEQYTAPATAHGTITFSPESPIAEDATVTLTAEPAAGYTFTADSWVFYKESGGDFVVDNSITVTDNQFTMPAYAIWVDGTFAPIAVTGVTLNKSTASIGVGDTETLTATIAPTNALNKTVTWTSDNTSVATVTAAGVVTGVALGSARITATTEDGDFEATCVVTVENVVTFDCSSDTKTSKNGVSFTCDGISTTDGFKFYKSSESTFSVTNGKITKIVFTCTASGTAKYGPGSFGTGAPTGYSYEGTTGTWTGKASSVTFTATDNQVRATKIKVTVDTVATPTFSVAGGEYSEAKSVGISCATDGASVYYTIDGSTPTSSSTAYSSAIDITETTTLKAIAIKSGVESKVATATYTMNRPDAPTFDPEEGIFNAAFTLHLSAADGATIYYTTNGDTPTSSSTEYSDGVSISTATTTVKAIAVKSGLTSDVASATYTYDTRPAPTFTLSATALDLKVNETSSVVSLTTNSDGAVTFSCEDAAVTLTGTGNSRTISANAAGEYTVNVATAATSNYLAGAGTITVTVTKKATTMVLTPTFSSKDLYVTKSGSVTGVPQYNSSDIDGAAVTYTSSDTKVATVAADGTITFKKAGSTTITASYAGNAEYEECSATYDLDLTDSTPQEAEVTVSLNSTSLGSTAPDGKTVTVNNVSVTTNTGSSTNDLVANDGHVRMYKNSNMVVTAPTGYVITKIVFTEPSSDKTWNDSPTASTGTYSSKSWSGTASSVTFTFSAGQCRIASITVTLAPTVTITAAKYATYCSPHDLDFSKTGIKVYKAKVSGDKAKLTEISDGIVPAGTGVILYKDVAEATTIAVPVTESDATITDNELVGTTARVLVKKTEDDVNFNYILQAGPVFNMAKTEGAYMPANRAYLSTTVDVSASGARLSVVFEDDQTTGIADVRSKKADVRGGIYDLQGRKVMNPVKGGLYIKNGRKIVIK